jgi:hypothetical protein
VWNLKDKRVAAGATLGSWGVIVFGNERNFPLTATQAFIRELIVTCVDTGMVGVFLMNRHHCNGSNPFSPLLSISGIS